ncbi:MAG: hypothetical protein IJZ08_01015 [Clostridia bacterium]|nr:hypothetical protein [Clostridia bacterium]
MKKILSLVLIGAMLLTALLSFTGCGSDADKILGTWETTWDMSDMLAKEVAGEEIAQYMQIKDFAVVMRFTFNEDGTYKMEVSEESLKAAFETLKGQFVEGMTAYMEDMLADSGLNMSVEEALALSGIDMDAIIEESFTEDMLDDVVDEFVSDGEYEVKDGKLYTFDKGESLDENEYIRYELSGKELVFSELVSDEDDSAEAAEYLLPLTLKKVG